uniref:arachidonate 5-lipoxygenase-activating protein isoform X3 n=1 Tax=Ictidomys tridecemlineatus TaxID=43179 RepID=UPI001A9E914C|nr:arachidonate 5-lipoxygenase-activating protein isoform X3 [Ictidomys tridecemlineatus]
MSNEERQSAGLHFPFLLRAGYNAGAKPVPSSQPQASMDQETVGNVVLLAIVTLISVIQNGFFAHKVEHESKMQNGRSFQRTGTLAFERVYTANSCLLRWTNVPVREAEVLCRLPGGEDSEHPWLHIWEAHHPVPAPHVPGRYTQLLPHPLFRK